MYVLGIHPDGDYFKVALLSFSHKKIQLLFLQEFRKDILDLNQLKRKILKEIRYKLERVEVVSALNPEEAFVKKIVFPFTKKAAIKKALPFQLEKLLPFLDEHVTTVSEMRVKKKETCVTLYTFFNETMQTHLQEIKNLGFDPDRVSTVARALFRFRNVFASDMREGVLFYFGWEKSYLVYVDSEEVKQSLVIDVGFRELIDAAREDHPHAKEIEISFLTEEIRKYFEKNLSSSHVKEVLKKLQRSLFRSFEYIKKKENKGNIDVVHLGYSLISLEMLACMTEIETRSIDIVPHLEFDRKQLRSYAIEIGLALDSSSRDELQLRIGDFTSSRHIMRIRRKLKAFLGFSVICSLITATLMTLFFIKKEGRISEEFQHIVEIGGEDPSNYKEVGRFWFSKEGLQKEMDRFLNHISGYKEEGVLLKDPPLVTALLQEVSNHMAEGCLIKDVEYECVHYPTIEKPKEGYQTDCKILFTAPTEEIAEKVYKSFLKANKRAVNQKSFAWVEGKNGYQMAFIFKD